jgi:adenylate cyclase
MFLPGSLVTNAIEGQTLFFAGKTDEAEKVLRATTDMDPSFWLSHLFLTRVYIKRKMFGDAMEAAAKAKQIAGDNSEALATIGYAAARAGMRDRANSTLKTLEDAAAARFVPAYNFAQVYLALGERTKALNLLDKAFDQREALMVFLKVDPKWDDLRSEPRFLTLMKRMKFELFNRYPSHSFKCIGASA